jgi:hypothetical protein
MLGTRMAAAFECLMSACHIARNVGADKRLVESSEFYIEVKRSLSPLKSLFYVKQNAFEER